MELTKYYLVAEFFRDTTGHMFNSFLEQLFEVVAAACSWNYLGQNVNSRWHHPCETLFGRHRLNILSWSQHSHYTRTCQRFELWLMNSKYLYGMWLPFAGLGASQKCKREGGQKLNQNYPDCNIHDLRYLYCYGNKKDYAVGCCHSARRNKIIFRW